ncbi:Tyrosine specific protein phosphatase and dual specificity protein phosphatase [Trichoderma guizhouense]|uniref:Tyrosine specific protein phosphatase and dual specificity protein phosphatase n=1 Tax=Trichoderma guizhouense TaxID=1491466 RepID=A0A1T3CLH5_9HYPO|nr:Tyrosine specific protein phosphatase and dual specificity protein phosphatase [Trichoderma guizhouense]
MASAPYISIPGVANFRDIGGTPIASHPGKQVRRNIVFRSARPDISTSRGKKKLQMLAITHTYDLRSTQELSSSKSYDRSKLIWAGTTTRVSVPVFRPEEYAPDAVVARFAKHGASCEGFAEAFSEILFSASHVQNKTRPFATILEHLSSGSNPPSPMLIHCSLGKDRTGVICALILSLCGVSDEDVAKDYSFSEKELAPLLPSHADKLSGNPAFKASKGTLQDAEILVRTRKENMLCFLMKLRKKYGSIEKCIIGHNLLQADGIARLRRNMIVDASKNHSIVDKWDEEDFA